VRKRQTRKKNEKSEQQLANSEGGKEGGKQETIADEGRRSLFFLILFYFILCFDARFSSLQLFQRRAAPKF